MTVLDQSRQTVQYPMRGSLFDAKLLTRIGTWNVRTLHQCGKLVQLLKEMGNYRMDILDISEMRWTGSGRFVSDNRTIIYSGHDTEHSRGVGIIMSPKAAKALIGWKPASDRIITARFITRLSKISVIQVYAPIEDADDVDKDAFYEQLQDTLDEAPRHDLVLLLGDFNAKIASNQQGYVQVIGPNGASEDTNDNGGRLISFCLENGLVIGNTCFEHKRIHKKTWRSPDGLTFNEIDFICFSKRWRSSLLDVRACRGADVGSDYYLLLAKCRLRLKRLPSGLKRPRPFAVEKFEDQKTVDQFQLELRNRFQLFTDEVDVDDRWIKFKAVILERAERTIGRCYA